MKTIGINLKDEIDPTGIMNEIEKMMRKHFPRVDYELFRMDNK
jgi:hypothetical protein